VWGGWESGSGYFRRLACILRTTKKVINFLRKKIKRVHPRENPGYACGLRPNTKNSLKHFGLPFSNYYRWDKNPI